MTKMISGISLRFSVVVLSSFLLRVDLRCGRLSGRLVGGVSLGRCGLDRLRLLVGGLSCGCRRLLRRRTVPPWHLIRIGLGRSGLGWLLGVHRLRWHNGRRWSGRGRVGSTWRYRLSGRCSRSRGDLALLLAPEVSERRLGNQRGWIVGQAEVWCQASVGEWMLESMVLVEVLGLLWSVQVVEANLEVPLAKGVGLVQVVVDGVLGFVQRVLLASVTVPSVSAIPTSIAVTTTVSTMAVTTSVSTMSVPAMSVTTSVSAMAVTTSVSAMTEAATVSAVRDAVSETAVRISIASVVSLATISFLLIAFLFRFIAMMVIIVVVVLMVLFHVMPVVFIVLVGPCHSNQKSDAKNQRSHFQDCFAPTGPTTDFAKTPQQAPPSCRSS